MGERVRKVERRNRRDSGATWRLTVGPALGLGWTGVIPTYTNYTQVEREPYPFTSTGRISRGSGLKGSVGSLTTSPASAPSEVGIKPFVSGLGAALLLVILASRLAQCQGHS